MHVIIEELNLVYRSATKAVLKTQTSIDPAVIHITRLFLAEGSNPHVLMLVGPGTEETFRSRDAVTLEAIQLKLSGRDGPWRFLLDNTKSYDTKETP